MKTVILLGALIASLTSFGFFKKSPKAKNENVKKIVNWKQSSHLIHKVA